VRPAGVAVVSGSRILDGEEGTDVGVLSLLGCNSPPEASVTAKNIKTIRKMRRIRGSSKVGQVMNSNAGVHCRVTLHIWPGAKA
jgi:hypothetical protein